MMGALTKNATTPTGPRMPQTRPTFAGRLRAAPGPAAKKGEERNRQHDNQRVEEQALAVVRPKLPEGLTFVLDRFEVRK
jgi:hypothetical protein